VWKRTLRAFVRNVPSMVAVGFLLLLVVLAIIGQFIVPFDPNTQDLAHSLAGPGAEHWLGQDKLGRDIFSRLIVATQVAVQATALGLGVSVLLGIPLGLVSGFIGGVFDNVVSRVVDAVMSLPPIVLALAILGIAGTGLTNAMIAVGVVTAPEFYRVARSVANNLRNATFIEAARIEGCSVGRIVFTHVLPMAIGPLLVQVTFNSGMVILAEASLSFLGLGVQPPTASWGSMVRDASQDIFVSQFPLFPPAIMIVLTVLAFQIIGDGLRDSLGRKRMLT
jgi:peptide/nickel transport system permease protein